MRRKIIPILLVFLFFGITSSVGAQMDLESEQQQTSQGEIQVEGRLSAEKHGEETWLIFLSRDAQSYIISGDLKEKLNNLRLELGQNNLVSLKGFKTKTGPLSCKQKRKYALDENNRTKLIVDAECIRYYYLRPTKILFSSQSEEAMPAPKREAEEEAKMLARSQGQDEKFVPMIPEYIKAKIKSINLKSPVKTMVIISREKDIPRREITLLLTTNTRVFKNMPKEKEPLLISEKMLKRGQKVNVVYHSEEFQKEALSIMLLE